MGRENEAVDLAWPGVAVAVECRLADPPLLDELVFRDAEPKKQQQAHRDMTMQVNVREQQTMETHMTNPDPATTT